MIAPVTTLPAGRCTHGGGATTPLHHTEPLLRQDRNGLRQAALNGVVKALLQGPSCASNRSFCNWSALLFRFRAVSTRSFSSNTRNNSCHLHVRQGFLGRHVAGQCLAA